MHLLPAIWLLCGPGLATEPGMAPDPFEPVLDRMEQVTASGYARGGTLLAIVALEEHADHPRAPLVRLQVAQYQRLHGLLREEELTLARGLEAYPARWRPWFELATLDAQLQRQDFGALVAAHSERADWSGPTSDAAHYYGAWGRAGDGDDAGARILLAKVRGELKPSAEGFSNDLEALQRRHRSPFAAGVLSILPGAGHAYAGDPVGAGANLIVTGGLGTAAAWFSTQEEPILTTVFGILGVGSLLAGVGDATRQAQSFNRAREVERFEALAERWWIHGEVGDNPERPLDIRVGSWDE